MIDPKEALARLKAGNARFVANTRQVDPHGHDFAFNEDPIAIVLGCCDHRVPPDILFDTGLGNLFTIRVAGNVVTPTQLGSIEHGARTFDPRLLVVMGHRRCGAVKATLRDQIHKEPPYSPHLVPIVDKIVPACTECLGRHPGTDFEQLSDDEFTKLAREVTLVNVRNSMRDLRTESEILRDLIDKGELLVVGAYYDMATGKVEFFEDW